MVNKSSRLLDLIYYWNTFCYAYLSFQYREEISCFNYAHVANEKETAETFENLIPFLVKADGLPLLQFWLLSCSCDLLKHPSHYPCPAAFSFFPFIPLVFMQRILYKSYFSPGEKQEDKSHLTWVNLCTTGVGFPDKDTFGSFQIHKG